MGRKEILAAYAAAILFVLGASAPVTALAQGIATPEATPDSGTYPPPELRVTVICPGGRQLVLATAPVAMNPVFKGVRTSGSRTTLRICEDTVVQAKCLDGDSGEKSDIAEWTYLFDRSKPVEVGCSGPNCPPKKRRVVKRAPKPKKPAPPTPGSSPLHPLHARTVIDGPVEVQGMVEVSGHLTTDTTIAGGRIEALIVEDPEAGLTQSQKLWLGLGIPAAVLTVAAIITGCVIASRPRDNLVTQTRGLTGGGF